MRIARLCTVCLLLAGVLMAQQAKAPKKTDKEAIQELVLANSMLINEGVLDAYGHVSVRSPSNPNHFFLAWHIPASVVTEADIVEYDFDSNPVNKDEKRTGYSERFIHGEIYRSRPDVMAITHFHASDVLPFGITGTPLQPMYHMAGFLGQGVPLFEIRGATTDGEMLIRTPALGKALARTLDNKQAALMRGHGAICVGPSLHVLVGRAYFMMLNARTQLQSMALGDGKINPLTAKEGVKTAEQDGYERAWTHFKWKLMKK